MLFLERSNGLLTIYITTTQLPPLIKWDCFIIAFLVGNEVPSLNPACKRVLFLIPTRSSSSILNTADILPKQKSFFSNIRCTCITFVSVFPMIIWNFIFAKVPNNKYLEVFISLNFQNSRKKRAQEIKPAKPYFGAFYRLYFLFRANDKQSKEESKGRPVFARI